MNDLPQSTEQEVDTIETLTVGGKKIEFCHTAVNGDMHLFIDGYHNPVVCPECIQPGLLVEAQVKGKQEKTE